MRALFVLALLCCAGALGATSAVPYASRGLMQDFKEFFELLPIDKIVAVANDYYENDKETQDALKYLRSKDFTAIWNQIFNNKDFQNFVNYLQNAGLNVIGLLNRIADFLKLPHFPANLKVAADRKGGLSGLVDDVIALLPLKELEALFQEKLKTSPEFKALYDKISSADFRKLVDFVKSSRELTELFQKLRQRGVDVDKFVQLVANLFGWKRN